MLVADELGILLAGDEPGDGLHGAGAVEGDDGGDVLNVLGLEAHADAGHARRLHLEHAGGAPLGEHPEDLGVAVGDGLQGEAGVGPPHQLHRVVQHRQVPKAQEVHFEEAQLLQHRHLELGDHRLVVFRQGHVVGHRQAGDDHAGGVGGGVAGHPLDGPGGVDEELHVLVLAVQLLEGLGDFQGVVQGDVEGGGHLLGDLVHPVVGHVQHPAHVPDAAPGGHGAEGDDLGHVVGAVLVLDVLDDLAPAADAEVHVDVGHGDPLRVQETLEHQAVFHGVDLGDGHAVGHHGPGGGAPARPHGDVVAFGVADEVGDDEEVVHEAHLPDDAHLVLQPLHVLPGAVRVATGEALAAKLLKIGVRVALPLRQVEFRQVVDTELEVHLAHVGDFLGVLQRLGVLGEEGGHLRLALDVELLSLEAHPAGVVLHLAGLDAHQNVLSPGVLLFQIVGVVGAHQGDARLFVDAGQARDNGGVVLQPVVLELQVVIPPAEEGVHLHRVGLGPLVVAVSDAAGQLPGEAGGEAHQALVALPQEVQVDAGLDVKALGVGLAHHMGEVAVARLVFAQQDEVAGRAVQLVDPVEAGAGGHIDLTADDGLDPLRLAGPVKVDDAVHVAVVGNGDGGLAQLLDPLGQLRDAAGPVQEGVFGVDVQVGEGHGGTSFFLSRGDGGRVFVYSLIVRRDVRPSGVVFLFPRKRNIPRPPKKSLWC